LEKLPFGEGADHETPHTLAAMNTRIRSLAILAVVCWASACASERSEPVATPPPDAVDAGIKADIDTYRAAVKAADDAFEVVRKTAIVAFKSRLRAECEASKDEAPEARAARWGLAVKVAVFAHDADVIEAYCACLAAREAAKEVLDAAVDDRNRTPDSVRAHKATMNAARTPASDKAAKAAEARIIAEGDRQADLLGGLTERATR